MSMGNKIQTYRKRAHLSQEQLAERLGVSRQAVTKWESDRSAPSTKNLAQLAGILEVSLDELAGNPPETPAEELQEENKPEIRAALQEEYNPDAKAGRIRKKIPFGRIYVGILIALFALFFITVQAGGQLIADLAITLINLLFLGGFVYVLILVIKVLKRKSEG